MITTQRKFITYRISSMVIGLSGGLWLDKNTPEKKTMYWNNNDKCVKSNTLEPLCRNWLPYTYHLILISKPKADGGKEIKRACRYHFMHMENEKLDCVAYLQNLGRYNSLLTVAPQIDRAELEILTRHFLDERSYYLHLIFSPTF